MAKKRTSKKKRTKKPTTTAKEPVKQEKPPAKPKKGGLISSLKAVFYDHKVKEVWGYVPESITWNELTKSGEIVLKAIDNTKHKFKVLSSTYYNTLMRRIERMHRKQSLDSYYHDEDPAKQKKVIAAVLEPAKKKGRDAENPILYRIVQDKDRGDYLLGVLSPRWKKTTSDKLYPALQPILKKNGFIVELEKSDGITGGRIVAEGKGKGVYKPRIVIDFGKKLDGYHAMHIIGGMEILACENMLTFDVRSRLGNSLKVKEGWRLRKLHSTDTEVIKNQLAEMIVEVGLYSTLISNAKKIKLSKKLLGDILDYYQDNSLLTKKAREEIEENWDDEEITQVPGTVYGLSMAVSYFGTHLEGIADKPMGVKLRKMAGELLVVTQSWKDYLKVIERSAKNLAERKKESEKKEEPKKEKPPQKPAKKPAPKKAKPKAPKKKVKKEKRSRKRKK
jgi:hypothetical protein